MSTGFEELISDDGMSNIVILAINVYKHKFQIQERVTRSSAWKIIRSSRHRLGINARMYCLIWWSSK